MLSSENIRKDKLKYIRMAAVISLTGNVLLAVLKIIVGTLSSSTALIGDGIDSASDVVISLVTFFVAKTISKPADTGHPWGHGRAEIVATVFLSFIIFFAGAQLIIASISNLINGNQQMAPSIIGILAALVSIIGKCLLAWSQFKLGNRAGSSMLKANGKNLASDMLISFSVLIGLVISILTRSMFADTIFAVLIGAWIIKTAIGIFLEANLELMDGNKDTEPYRVITEAVDAVEGAYHPHRARMRRVAGFWDIDFDIYVDPKATVYKAHQIASQVEKEIKLRLENVYDIMIHVEPLGDDALETFGLSEDQMQGRGEENGMGK